MRRKDNELYVVVAGEYPEDYELIAVCTTMLQVQAVQSKIKNDTRRQRDMRTTHVQCVRAYRRDEAVR